jgi:zinc transport system permease protein
MLLGIGLGLGGAGGGVLASISANPGPGATIVLLAIAGFFVVTLAASVVRAMRRRQPGQAVDQVAPEPEVILDRTY